MTLSAITLVLLAGVLAAALGGLLMWVILRADEQAQRTRMDAYEPPICLRCGALIYDEDPPCCAGPLPSDA